MKGAISGGGHCDGCGGDGIGGCCRFGADCGDCGEDGTGWCHQSASNCAACTGSFDPSGPAPGCGGNPGNPGWVSGTYTTGYWDCCKPSCSWPGKGNVNRPTLSCDANTGQKLFDANEGSVC